MTETDSSPWNIGLLGCFRMIKGDVYPLETSG